MHLFPLCLKLRNSLRNTTFIFHLIILWLQLNVFTVVLRNHWNSTGSWVKVLRYSSWSIFSLNWMLDWSGWYFVIWYLRAKWSYCIIHFLWVSFIFIKFLWIYLSYDIPCLYWFLQIFICIFRHHPSSIVRKLALLTVSILTFDIIKSIWFWSFHLIAISKSISYHLVS